MILDLLPEEINFEGEAVLDQTYKLDPNATPFSKENFADPQHILLTGATVASCTFGNINSAKGFLGSIPFERTNCKISKRKDLLHYTCYYH